MGCPLRFVRLLERQDRALAANAPTVVVKDPALQNDPMAWNDERNGVRADGAADSACSPRISDGGCHVLIGRQTAERNLEECLPDLDLKVRAPQVQPQGVADPVPHGTAGEIIAPA